MLNDRYTHIYLNFPNSQAYFECLFGTMTFQEFHGFLDYCMAEFQAADAAEYRRVRVLIIALARKLLETAYFSDGLPEERRQDTSALAEALFKVAKGFYPPDKISAVETAWATEVDYMKKWGWPTLAYEALAPHHVFKGDPY
jgi:hypothetical protein